MLVRGECGSASSGTPVGRGPRWVGDQTRRTRRYIQPMSQARPTAAQLPGAARLSANCTGPSRSAAQAQPGHRNIRWTDLNGRVQFGKLQRIVWPVRAFWEDTRDFLFTRWSWNYCKERQLKLVQSCYTLAITVFRGYLYLRPRYFPQPCWIDLP